MGDGASIPMILLTTVALGRIPYGRAMGTVVGDSIVFCSQHRPQFCSNDSVIRSGEQRNWFSIELHGILLQN